MNDRSDAPASGSASDNPASRNKTAPARQVFELAGGYSVVKRGGWAWAVHLHGEPLRLACGDAVYIDGDGEEVRTFLATISVEVQP